MIRNTAAPHCSCAYDGWVTYFDHCVHVAHTARWAGMPDPLVHTQGSAYGVFILYVCFCKEMPENMIFIILLLH